MTDPHHTPATQPGATRPLFTQDEKDILRAEDRSAAAAIVLLMSGVFIVGLVMYAIIAYQVS